MPMPTRSWAMAICLAPLVLGPRRPYVAQPADVDPAAHCGAPQGPRYPPNHNILWWAHPRGTRCWGHYSIVVTRVSRTVGPFLPPEEPIRACSGLLAAISSSASVIGGCFIRAAARLLR